MLNTLKRGIYMLSPFATCSNFKVIKDLMKQLLLPVKWGLGAQRYPSGGGFDWQAGRGDWEGTWCQMTIVGLRCCSGGAYQIYFSVSF